MLTDNLYRQFKVIGVRQFVGTVLAFDWEINCADSVRLFLWTVCTVRERLVLRKSFYRQGKMNVGRQFQVYTHTLK